MSLDNNSFQTYIDYIGFKQYFNYWDFNWGVQYKTLNKITYETFLKRSDTILFRQLWNKYRNRKSIQQLFISAFILDPNFYIANIYNITDDLNDFHPLRMKSIKDLLLTFDKDCVNIKQYISYNDLKFLDLLKPNNMSPKILRSASQIPVNLETIAILDKAFKFSKINNESPIWEKHRKMIFKYSQLLNIHTDHLKVSINSLLKENV